MSMGSLLVLVPSLVLGDAGACSGISPSMPGRIRLEPNPRLFRKVNRDLTPGELERADQVKGKSREEVLRILGHPSEVVRYKGGDETWWYEWNEPISVQFHKEEVIRIGGRQTGVISYPQLVQ